MGAGESKPQKITDLKSFKIVMDNIASGYITSMNFKDMTDLQDPEKSRDLLILTEKIIQEQLEKHHVAYDKKVEGTMGNTEKKKGRTIYTATKEELENLKLSKELHQEIANALAKKYLKIANIFAAIYVVIKPEYEGTTKNKKSMSFMREKPHGAPIQNFCHKRLQSLIGKGTDGIGTTKDIIVNPDICDFGIDRDSEQSTKFENEPGILELNNLYYDEYDPMTQSFTKMSESMKQTLKNDATAFFEAITGSTIQKYNESLKSGEAKVTINSFADVTMDTLYKTPACNKYDKKIDTIDDVSNLKIAGIGSYRQDYTGKTAIFQKYGTHLRTMKEDAEKNYLALTSIIEEIFVQKGSDYRINSKLKDSEIDELVNKTRSLISKMYIQCAKDFKTGIDLFKQIVAEAISIQQTRIVRNQSVSAEDLLNIATTKTDLIL